MITIAHICIEGHRDEVKQKLHLCILHMIKAKHQEAKTLAANTMLQIKWHIRFGRDDTKTLGKGPPSLHTTIFKSRSSKKNRNAYEENVHE